MVPAPANGALEQPAFLLKLGIEGDESPGFPPEGLGTHCLESGDQFDGLLGAGTLCRHSRCGGELRERVLLSRSDSSAQASLALSRGIDFETPDQTLPPASVPETPSFHCVCLIPVQSRLTSRLRGLTLRLPQSLAGLLRKINKYFLHYPINSFTSFSAISSQLQ